MKKLIFFFLMFFTLTMNAQTFSDYKDYVEHNEKKSISYAKAHELNVGLVHGNKIDWDTLKEPVNFYVELSDNGLIINSAIKQTYRFIELLTKEDKIDEKLTKYYSIDSEQKTCVIWIFEFKNRNNKVTVAAEYADVAWFYNCDPFTKK